MVKNLPADAGSIRDAGSILGSGRSSGGGHGNPLQYSCLENPLGQRSLVGYTIWLQRVRHDSTQHTPEEVVAELGFEECGEVVRLTRLYVWGIIS